MNIYLSYADEDVASGSHLKAALQPFQRAHSFTVWSRQDILGGGIWQREMAEHMSHADLFVPLISASFLVSRHGEAETTAAIQLAAMGRLAIVLVLLRPTLWEVTALHAFSVLPSNGKPISGWHQKDRAWLEVQKGVLERVRGRT